MERMGNVASQKMIKSMSQESVHDGKNEDEGNVDNLANAGSGKMVGSMSQGSMEGQEPLRHEDDIENSNGGRDGPEEGEGDMGAQYDERDGGDPEEREGQYEGEGSQPMEGGEPEGEGEGESMGTPEGKSAS